MIERTKSQQDPERFAAAVNAPYYQTDLAVAQYCDAHYGPDRFGIGNFSREMVFLCCQVLDGRAPLRALDLGCAVGRSSFELARFFKQVTAIDSSRRFIDVARRIQKRARVCYSLLEEGDILSDHKVYLADLGLAETAQRVSFCQGDAQALDPELGPYDLILAANLIDRLPHPARFLVNIHRHLVSGGILVLASPYNWLEEYTAKKYWLGGHFRFGRPVDSLNGLRQRLNRHFQLIGEPCELEFVIRETARSYRHSISQVTCWQLLER
ncbi:putative 4-mercaptohistidine N1-methyltranferase [Malonomonas rubra DSM 5091]|uniref:Putative 4-mercaptohistidine N1-methyltranferase n=1 Tax=Malonomonas rubra DSM 5091 TaxID=1122189 RepID=A0A1M6JBD2_MALRU|nr:putative 4-mercaptohistidine N1-methyltransferase [Malonomonas rubra]SHJ43977.1 putative 4-mercaptohistidine N1-methyltranferase [Malonomonas rubra DSM 5091]